MMANFEYLNNDSEYSDIKQDIEDLKNEITESKQDEDDVTNTSNETDTNGSNEVDMASEQSVENTESNEEVELENSFWWVPLKYTEKYENIIDKDKVLTPTKWVTRFPDSPIAYKGKDWRLIEEKQTHKETFYSQKVLPWKWLKIPGRHTAEDGTVRDWDWYIVVACNYLPKWSEIMTTLWPWKVYDRWGMTGHWIDIYTDWSTPRSTHKKRWNKKKA